MYKILIDRAFTENEDSLFKNIELHKKFNTQCCTIYNKDLAEFRKEEMCPKDVNGYSYAQERQRQQTYGIPNN